LRTHFTTKKLGCDKNIAATILVLLSVASNAFSQSTAVNSVVKKSTSLGETYKAIFAPLPEVAKLDKDSRLASQVMLGEKLYDDPGLSKSGKISCNSCHDLKTYGVDNQPTSLL